MILKMLQKIIILELRFTNFFVLHTDKGHGRIIIWLPEVVSERDPVCKK